MKKHLILIFLLLSFSNLQAQNTDSFHYKRNLLYFELYGPGIVASFNYERLFNLSRHLKLIPGIGYSRYWHDITLHSDFNLRFPGRPGPDIAYKGTFDIKAVPVKLGLFYFIKNFGFGGGLVVEPATIEEPIEGLTAPYIGLNGYIFIFPYFSFKYYHSSGIYFGVEVAINRDEWQEVFPYNLKHNTNIKFYQNVDYHKTWLITPGFDIGYAFNFSKKSYVPSWRKVKSADSFPYYRKNLLYFELYGPGIVTSINYERIFNLSKHVKLIPAIGCSYYWRHNPGPLHGNIHIKAIPMKLGMFYFLKNFALGGGIVIEPANITDEDIGNILENNNYTFIFPYLSLKYYHSSGVYIGIEAAINSAKFGGKPFPLEADHHTDINSYQCADCNTWNLTPGLDIGYDF